MKFFVGQVIEFDELPDEFPFKTKGKVIAIYPISEDNNFEIEDDYEVEVLVENGNKNIFLYFQNEGSSWDATGYWKVEIQP